MATLTIIHWRDIPSQVVVRAGRTNHKRMLSERFQEAIDRAAMRAGKGSSDAYLSEWTRKQQACDADVEQVLAQTVAKLEQDFDDALLEQMVRNKGFAPTSSRESSV